MRKYLDYKHSSWSRIYFSDDTDMKMIAKKIEEEHLVPSELCDEDLGFIEWETMIETEEYITPKENDNQPTIEIYEGENMQECIWDNVNKDKQ